MKIVLLILNGNTTSYHLTDYAVSMAKNGIAFLHTVFLTQAPAIEEYDYPFPNDLMLTRNSLSSKIIEAEENDLLKDNIRLFEDKCKAAEVACLIERGNGMTLERLIDISTFADYILADTVTEPGKHHLADLLTNVHCPVFLLSSPTEKQRLSVLTYDGSFASMFALKTFSQLFPEWTDLPARHVYVAENDKPVLPNEKYITQWLHSHFSNAVIEILSGALKESLVSYINAVPEAVVVMGSFGRNKVSRFFRESIASTIIDDCKVSLFITHPS